MPSQYVVVVGSLAVGLEAIFGPFPYEEAAEDWADAARDLGTSDTFVYALLPPETKA